LIKTSKYLIIATLFALPLVGNGQSSCPVRILSVNPRATSSLPSTRNATALRVEYHNASQFGIRGITFGMSTGGLQKTKELTVQSPLVAGASDGAQWSGYTWLNTGTATIKVWPKIIVFSDGSKWTPSGSKQQCSFSTADADRVQLGIGGGRDTIPIASKAPAGGMTAEQKMALIQEGKASLISVRTYPDGANVDVDGKFIGNTPLTFVMTKNSEARSLLITLNGYKMYSRSITPDGTTIPVVVTLVPFKAQ